MQPESQVMRLRYLCPLRRIPPSSYLSLKMCFWSAPLQNDVFLNWRERGNWPVIPALLTTWAIMHMYENLCRASSHLADGALIHAAWFGHNPSSCLGVAAEGNPSHLPACLSILSCWWMYLLAMEIYHHIKGSKFYFKITTSVLMWRSKLLHVLLDILVPSCRLAKPTVLFFSSLERQHSLSLSNWVPFLVLVFCPQRGNISVDFPLCFHASLLVRAAMFTPNYFPCWELLIGFCCLAAALWARVHKVWSSEEGAASQLSESLL